MSLGSAIDHYLPGNCRLRGEGACANPRGPCVLAEWATLLRRSDGSAEAAVTAGVVRRPPWAGERAWRLSGPACPGCSRPRNSPTRRPGRHAPGRGSARWSRGIDPRQTRASGCASCRPHDVDDSGRAQRTGMPGGLGWAAASGRPVSRLSGAECPGSSLERDRMVRVGAAAGTGFVGVQCHAWRCDGRR